jgi:EAL domain-containing protein (putative c-di-GMP-specific phosphodiesterase class I)
VLLEDAAAPRAVRIQFSEARTAPVDSRHGGDSRVAAATDVQLLVEAGRAEVEAPRSVLPLQATFDAYRRALSHGEFTLHYQARVRLASGEVTGYEALIRRTDSESSSSPADLIEMAERSGFGAELGEWVLRSAASQSAAWRRCGLTVPIAVNLSSSQLWGDGLVGLLEELTAQDPALGAHLELELAEPLFALHIEDTTRLLKELARMGLSVQVDQFGVGGAHLHRLGQMPVRGLKIDRALVNAAQGSAEARRLVRAAIALSRAMELNVIAVGVETTAQYNFLKSWGCPEAQGFLIARPSPAGEVARTWTARRSI